MGKGGANQNESKRNEIIMISPTINETEIRKIEEINKTKAKFIENLAFLSRKDREDSNY